MKDQYKSKYLEQAVFLNAVARTPMSREAAGVPEAFFPFNLPESERPEQYNIFKKRADSETRD